MALWFDSAAVAGPMALAELSAALSSAQGGDRIELAGGDYGKVWVDNVFASDVTIVSADPSDPAIFHELHIIGATHIVFDGLVLDYINDPADPYFVKPFEVSNSSFVTIRNSVFDGDEIPSANGSGDYGTGYGLWVRFSEHVVIENNEIFEFLRAVNVGSSTDIVLRANDIHTVRSDGLDFWNVHGVLIEDNWIHDFKRDLGLDHPDMIQFWNVVPGEFSEDVIIRGNFLDAGDGGWTQSIFIGNETVFRDGTGFESYYRNFLIEDNVIYNDHVHGISIGGVDGLQILNNTLLYNISINDPNNLGGGAPIINIFGKTLNATIEGNIAHDEVRNLGDFFDVVGSNYLVQRDNPSGANYYGDLFVNALVDGTSLADLRALSGGEIETLGVGAEMTRSDIALDVSPVR
jgi:hypothetical protein